MLRDESIFEMEGLCNDTCSREGICSDRLRMLVSQMRAYRQKCDTFRQLCLFERLETSVARISDKSQLCVWRRQDLYSTMHVHCLNEVNNSWAVETGT